jgi:membrane-associated phospholipid phosphatase
VIRRWAVWSVTLFGVAVALGLLVTNTSLTTPDETRLDERLQQAHTGWLTSLMTAVTDAASPAAGLAVIAVWVGALLVARRPVTAVQTFLVVAVGWNVSLLMKSAIGRHRPPMADEAHNSFPSGHVSFATACLFAAYFLARGTRWQRPVLVVGPVVVAAVMFSRIYLGAHYLTDTVGAVLTASAAVVLLTGVWPYLRAVLPFHEQHHAPPAGVRAERAR